MPTSRTAGGHTTATSPLCHRGAKTNNRDERDRDRDMPTTKMRLLLWVVCVVGVASVGSAALGGCDDGGSSDPQTTTAADTSGAEDTSGGLDVSKDDTHETDDTSTTDDTNTADATNTTDTADTHNLPPPEFSTTDQALDLVNPFVGSGGGGFAFGGMTPAAQRPLGWTRLGPDTTNGGSHGEVQHFGGVFFDDPHIRGFSHTHFVGTGVADYGNLRVLPLSTIEGERPDLRYAPFDRDSHQASPGLYSVHLTDPDVQVSLTAGYWSGAHRYTFSEAGTVHLAIDAASSVTDDGVQAASIQINTNGMVEGWVRYRGGYVGRRNPFTLYFSVFPMAPVGERRVWDSAGFRPLGEVEVVEDVEAGAVISFDVNAGQSVELRVGLSLIDLDAARRNCIAEIPPAKSFDALALEARTEWAEKLGLARIAGGTPEQQEIFFTALYNLYRMPSRLDEVDGRYVGLDAEVHTLTESTAEPWRYYTDLSLWDSFRTTHPWFALTDHGVARDCLRSLMEMFAVGGVMPRWPAALSYTGGMIGSSADFLFAEGALKGIEGIDYDAAFDALMVHALGDPPANDFLNGRGNMEAYLEHGFLPADVTDESVARTLEYVYADAALGLMATHLGRPEAADLTERGRNWRLLLHPESGFLQPKQSDGTWTEGFNPLTVDMRSGFFTEGNAWHWRFYAPHDLLGLQEALGGPEAMNEALEFFFKRSMLGRRATGFVSAFLPDLYYWHGNEPPMHVVYGFLVAGQRERFGFWLRQIQTRLYSTAPDGLAGNDDGGTLSGWYVFSALGLYPIAGTDLYFIGAPLFERAEIVLPNDKTLSIEAPGASADRWHVTAVTLDGAPVDGIFLTHAQIQDGGVLSFTLAPPTEAP